MSRIKPLNPGACILTSIFLRVAAASGLSAEFGFVHPGLLQSREDFARMKMAVAAKEEPVYSGYEVFRKHAQSQLDYRMRGPLETVGRNPTVGQGNYDTDANAAYQCAVMWCITGDIAYANKSKEIINAWSATLKSITGRDAVLMAGLGPFKMVNAAEIVRYAEAGWTQNEIQQTERHFREVVYPVIRDFAPFANGNWDTAAIKTMLAIAVFCNDRTIFERALHYYLDGSGDGRLSFYIINATGQCQESGRDQQHTQLGLAHLGDCCEIAWHQGLDLYGYEDNLLLKGCEYTAKYNLGENVPFAETLDRTGKYHHTAISDNGRGRFRPVFEEIYNHYANRIGISAPYSQRAVERIRPEGPGAPGADHVGFGTLLFARQTWKGATPLGNAPAAPAGLLADGSAEGNKLTWIAAVGAKNYTIKRADKGPLKIIARNVPSPAYMDAEVKSGELYRYVITASNSAGESPGSASTFICAGLPKEWDHQNIGANALPARAQFNGTEYELEAAGANIGGTNDQCQFAFIPVNGNIITTARFVPQTSSQCARFGLMLRDGSSPAASNVSLLLASEPSGQMEASGWRACLTARAQPGALTMNTSDARNLSEPFVGNGRLTGSCWLRLERVGNAFTGSISSDAKTWVRLGEISVPLQGKLNAGLVVCSGLPGITTAVVFDHVIITNAASLPAGPGP